MTTSQRFVWLFVAPLIIIVVGSLIVERYKYLVAPHEITRQNSLPLIDNSKLLFSLQGGNNDLLGILVTNDGDRSGSITGATITWKDHDDAIELELHLANPEGKASRETARIIEPHKSQLVEFVLIKGYNQPVIQDSGECILEISYTDYTGNAANKKIDNVGCGDFRGFLTSVSAE